MSRPRSEDKKNAILKAAIDAIASSGLSASTLSIARNAGVAEGTLFRYFATKDVLVGAVFDSIVEDLQVCLARNYQPSASLKWRTQIVWDNYIEWGVCNPSSYSTVNQLAVSGKITKEQLERAMMLCADMNFKANMLPFAGLTLDQSSDFIDAALTAIINTTISFVSLNPDIAQNYKMAGFEILWATINMRSII